MTARRPGARAAAPTLAAAFALAFGLAVVLGAAGPATAQVPTTWALVDSATFEIYQDDRQLGLEEYRAYRTNDTLIIGSALAMPDLPKGSLLPSIKNTTFLRRASDSWPFVFQIHEVRGDTTKPISISVTFSDTTAMVVHEVDGAGRASGIALPPGRLYLLEPGTYAQVQTLVGDFVRSSQNKRRQPVLIPSAKTVVDIHLTRGPRERLGQEGRVVETTRVNLTDKFVQLVAWVDQEGRMWKLEAPRQGLRVERALGAALPAAAPAGAKAKARAKTKKG